MNYKDLAKIYRHVGEVATIPIAIIGLILFAVFLVPTEAVAQDIADANSKKPEAIKVLEIGKASDRTFKRTTEKFWQSYDSSVPLYIISYGSDKSVARRERLITNSISFRNYDRARITLVRGGSGSGEKTVIWKVPYGADNPEP